MKHISTDKHANEFKVVSSTRSAQAAIMVLEPGASSDDKLSNEHPRSEQWVYVVSGTGTASAVKAGGRRRSVNLGPGSLLTIEKGERHQIRNTGWRALTTVNFYVPPAYTAAGTVLSTAKK